MRKLKIKSKLMAIAAMLSLVLAGGVKVYADSGFSTVTLSPINQKIVLIPGETYKGSLSVSNANEAKFDVNYSVVVESFSEHGVEGGRGDYGQVDTVTRTNYNQMMDWITLDTTEGVLAPNETDTIGFTIEVPEDAPAGGQYATIIVADNGDEGSLEGGVNIKSIMRIASIIYAEVAGETREEGVITENTMPTFLLNGPLKASSMVRNNGNVHTDATYVLQVWPLFSNEEICTNEENPGVSLILPETEAYHAESCDLPTMGIFRAKQTVKIFGETSIVEKTIIVCPLWMLFVIIFVIVLIIFYFVMKIRGRKKAARKSQNA